MDRLTIGPQVTNLPHRLKSVPPRDLVRGISREGLIRQPHASKDHLIGADGGWRRKIDGAQRGDVIILIDAVAADAESADQHSVPIQRETAGEKHNSALIGIGRLRALRAWICYVVGVEIEERSWRCVVDARRVKRLR